MTKEEKAFHNRNIVHRNINGRMIRLTWNEYINDQQYLVNQNYVINLKAYFLGYKPK